MNPGRKDVQLAYSTTAWVANQPVKKPIPAGGFRAGNNTVNSVKFPGSLPSRPTGGQS
jgi:hypothetical protein